MLKNLLGRLFRWANPSAETSTPIAPSAGETGTGDEEALNLPATLGFVSHRPIVDKAQRVVAYEFTVKDNLQHAGHRPAFDRLLIDTLKNMNIFRLLAYRRAFIHVSLDAVGEPLLLELPADSVIYVLEPGAHSAIDHALLQRLAALRAQGLRFALAPACLEALAANESVRAQLVQQLDYLVLDCASMQMGGAAALLAQQSPTPARWLARNICTAEELEVCLHAPDGRFTLFHGPYLAIPHTTATGKTNSNQGRVLEIMRLLRANAPAAEIEAQFKLDSLLLFKLLRFVNSPVNGLARRIQSIEESLLLLGREVLFKWLSLLLFSAESDSGSTLSLLEKSLIRARFMEKLGAGHANKIETEHLFLTGMFSMLATLLNIPLAHALEALDLPFTISDALLHQKGMFAAPLQLAIACEHGDEPLITRLAAQLQQPLEQVNSMYMDAIVWAQEVLRESEAQNDVATV
jgi:EAL and modified HD-GYP domain-containing signal transduction protein